MTEEKSKTVVICIATEKGGSAKTSLAAALVSLGAKKGLNSLLVDLDRQGNGGEALGAEYDKPGAKEFVLGENYEVQKVSENIGVLCASQDLEGGRMYSLHPEHLYDTMDKSIADLIVFDCPPTNLKMQRMAMSASDICLVPTDSSSFGIKAAATVISELNTHKNKGRPCARKWCLIAAKLNLSIAKHKSLTEDLGKMEVFKNVKTFVFRQDQKVCDAGDEGVPLFEYAPKCKAAKDVEEIFNWALDG